MKSSFSSVAVEEQQHHAAADDDERKEGDVVLEDVAIHGGDDDNNNNPNKSRRSRRDDDHDDDPTDHSSCSTNNDDDDETDSDVYCEQVISATERDMTGLGAVWVLAGLIATVSFVLILQFDAHAGSSSSSSSSSSFPLHVAEDDSEICAVDAGTTAVVPPFWQRLLEFEVEIVQNLFHAALLGAAALIVRMRGDVVWLYYVRHTVLFFVPVSVAYVAVDVYQLIQHSHHHDLHAGYYWVRIGIATAFACSSLLAFLRLNPICRALQRYAFHQQQQQQQQRGAYKSVIKAQRVLCLSAVWVQVAFFLFLIMTTIQWFRQQMGCLGDEDFFSTTSSSFQDKQQHRRLEEAIVDEPSFLNDETNNGSSFSDDTAAAMQQDDDESQLGQLQPFVMAYSMAAHQTFLLALIMVAALYPNDAASVTAALLASAWRTSAAGGSWLRVVTDGAFAAGQQRYRWSMLFTSLEFISQLGAVVACLVLLYVQKKQQKSSMRQHRQTSKPQLVPTHEDSEPEEEDPSSNNESDGIFLDNSSSSSDHQNQNKNQAGKNNDNNDATNQLEPAFLSASRIVRSGEHSTRQRWGARLLGMASVVLLMEMTAECILLLRQTFLHSATAHETYKWGMHAAAMYISVVVMSLDHPRMYHECIRPVLTVVCPVGSLVALWQLVTLLCYEDDDDNNLQQQQGQQQEGGKTTSLIFDEGMYTYLVALLFAVRAMAGFVQTVGLALLDDVRERRNHPAQQQEQQKQQQKSQDGQWMSVDTKSTATTTAAAAWNANSISQCVVAAAEKWQRLRMQAIYALATYLGVYFLYVMLAVVKGSCTQPMLSPMIPFSDNSSNNNMSMSSSNDDDNNDMGSMACEMTSHMDVMLMQSWPGLGLFFHFGILIPLFASDGIALGTRNAQEAFRTRPSYRPSLPIASLFAGHLAILMAAHLFWDYHQTDSWSWVVQTHNPMLHFSRRVLLVLWMTAAAYLARCLHRLGQIPRSFSSVSSSSGGTRQRELL